MITIDITTALADLERRRLLADAAVDRAKAKHDAAQAAHAAAWAAFKAAFEAYEADKTDARWGAYKAALADERSAYRADKQAWGRLTAAWTRRRSLVIKTA